MIIDCFNLITVVPDKKYKMQKKHLLIIDDDKRIRNLLKQFLLSYNYRISLAPNAKQARTLIKNIDFDLLIIDVMMPGEDGLSLTKHISSNFDTPILLLSAKVETSERILGLEMGADDYLAKPFEPRELVLRVEAILKRNKNKNEARIPNFINIGDLRYDTIRNELWNGLTQIHLTSLEIKLMEIFVKKANTIIERAELTQSVLSKSKISNNHTNQNRHIDVQIKRLREKLEINPKSPRYLQTVRGHGYKLAPS